MIRRFIQLCSYTVWDFFSAYAPLSACILAVFSFFLCFLCICAPVLYHLVVKAASIDRYSCLSGSLPLLFLNACAISCVLRRINTVAVKRIENKYARDSARVQRLFIVLSVASSSWNKHIDLSRCHTRLVAQCALGLQYNTIQYKICKAPCCRGFRGEVFVFKRRSSSIASCCSDSYTTVVFVDCMQKASRCGRRD